MDIQQLLEQRNGTYKEWRSIIEPRFSCVVCLAPKLKMVYGLCQHKICLDCGYEANGSLKEPFCRCPTCQRENVFPLRKPNVPEDNITAQKLCGVRACKYEGCSQEIWEWEKDEHELYCSYRVSTPKCTPERKVNNSSFKAKHRSVSSQTITRTYSLRPSNKLDENLQCSKRAKISPTRYNFRSRSQSNRGPNH